MNVLCLTPYYPNRFEPWFGLFVRDQVEALGDEGVRTVVVNPVVWLPRRLGRLSARWDMLGALPTRERVGHQEVHHPRYLKGPGARLLEVSGVSLAASMVPWVLRHARHVDLIHAHGILPYGQAADLLGRLLGVPFVLTAHGRPDTEGGMYRGLAKRMAYRAALRHAAAVILVGHPLREWILSLGAPAERLEIVYNGARVPPASELRPLRVQGWAERFVVLSVSNLIPTKGVQDTLRALAALARDGDHDTVYAIIGDGPDRQRLEALAAALGLAERVRFLGWKAHDDVLRYMVGADVFALPSWVEAFGIVYVEAMACGLPIIGVRDQGAAQFIEEGREGLLVDPRSPAQVAAAISRLKRDGATRRRLAEAGRALARDALTWQANARHMRQIYDRVLATAACRPAGREA